MKWQLSIAVLLSITGRLVAEGNLVDGPAADLLYDPDTGNVVLDAQDTESGSFLNIGLTNDEGRMTPVHKDRIPWICANCDNTPKSIFFQNLSAEFTPRIDLGPIFPTGMTTAEELSEFVDRGRYLSAFGPVGGPFDLIIVPEPRTATIAAVAVLAVILHGSGVRQRQKSIARGHVSLTITCKCVL